GNLPVGCRGAQGRAGPSSIQSARGSAGMRAQPFRVRPCPSRYAAAGGVEAGPGGHSERGGGMGQGHRGTGRGGGTLSAYVSDLGLGFRMLRRAPGFATSAIVALALGIGSSTASFSLVRGVLLEPLPWLEPERLIELRELGEGRVFYPSYPNFDDWRTRSRSLSIVAVQPLGEQPTEGPDGPARASVLGISRGFFETLRVPPSSGRTFSDEENAPGGAAV